LTKPAGARWKAGLDQAAVRLDEAKPSLAGRGRVLAAKKARPEVSTRSGPASMGPGFILARICPPDDAGDVHKGAEAMGTGRSEPYDVSRFNSGPVSG